jgi:hypothetical protein
MKLETAKVIANMIVEALLISDIKAEIGGGIYKGKPEVHDIDIVVKADYPDEEQEVQAIGSKFALNSDVDVPIEFYIADSYNYDGLLKAIRAHRHEVIKWRMMKGLKYKKFVFP